jgi:ABC-2 type transport system ATP-binding protein
VPQELVFDPFFSVRETLRIQSGYFGVKNNDAWIDELLAELGLADKANANMRQLSGGMKRRVLVAQALVHKPAGDRAGRTHGRRGRGTAPDAVAASSRA